MYNKLKTNNVYLRDNATFSVDESKIIGFCRGKEVFDEHPTFKKRFLNSLNTDIVVGLIERKIRGKSSMSLS